MFDRSVWVSTFGLYNDGLLIGEWFDLDTEDVPTSRQEFVDAMGDRLDGIAGSVIGEEVWCFDVQGFPANEEMAPSEAISQHEELTALEESLGNDKDAVSAFLEEYSYSWREDATSVCGFTAWDSWEEYAGDMIDNCGEEIPEHIARYIDYKLLGNDLRIETESYGEHNGMIFIFQM